MNPSRAHFLAASLLAAAFAAPAQTAAPAEQADLDALERAAQQAEGPKRRILEAALREEREAVRRRAEQEAARRERQEAAKQETARRAEREAAARPAAARPEAPPASTPAPAAEPSPVVALAPAVMPQQLPMPVPPPTPEPAPAAAAETRVAELPPPQLLAQSEINVRPGMFKRGSRRAVEVVLDLMITADGSIALAEPRAAGNRALESAVADAVRGWRYQPQPAARTHVLRVQVRPPE